MNKYLKILASCGGVGLSEGGISAESVIATTFSNPEL